MAYPHFNRVCCYTVNVSDENMAILVARSRAALLVVQFLPSQSTCHWGRTGITHTVVGLPLSQYQLSFTKFGTVSGLPSLQGQQYVSAVPDE